MEDVSFFQNTIAAVIENEKLRANKVFWVKSLYSFYNFLFTRHIKKRKETLSSFETLCFC